MKRIIFGIFAHPDDASFGPSGTLAMAAARNVPVHLVCATCGGAGTNPDKIDHLADIREDEEKHAANIIGASKLELLRYEDGQLCNEKYLDIADRLINYIRQETPTDTHVTLITFDPNGISGHIDHIVISQVVTYVYLKLRDELAIELKYFCISTTLSPRANTDWLHMPQGRSDHEVDEVVDVRSVREQKIAAIKAHHTQRGDAEMHLSRGDALFDEHFMWYKD